MHIAEGGRLLVDSAYEPPPPPQLRPCLRRWLCNRVRLGRFERRLPRGLRHRLHLCVPLYSQCSDKGPRTCRVPKGARTSQGRGRGAVGKVSNRAAHDAEALQCQCRVGSLRALHTCGSRIARASHNGGQSSGQRARRTRTSRAWQRWVNAVAAVAVSYSLAANAPLEYSWHAALASLSVNERRPRSESGLSKAGSRATANS